MQDEKVIVIDINLTRGLVALLALALLVTALLGYLAWGQREVAASGPQAPLDHAQDRPFDYAQDRPLASSAGIRQYYMTKTWHKGANTLTACASGYHMASLWEILDLSNLKYNTDLGYVQRDSGQGPPSGWTMGWVRTGYSSDASTTAGRGNCNAWTSSDGGHSGTLACLPSNWTAGQDVHVWYVAPTSCSTICPVWCVED